MLYSYYNYHCIYTIDVICRWSVHFRLETLRADCSAATPTLEKAVWERKKMYIRARRQLQHSVDWTTKKSHRKNSCRGRMMTGHGAGESRTFGHITAVQNWPWTSPPTSALNFLTTWRRHQWIKYYFLKRRFKFWNSYVRLRVVNFLNTNSR